MNVTLSWPVLAIIIFVLITQIWAWTRDDSANFGPSDREFSVFLVSILDTLFIAAVGGIWIW